MIQSNQLEFLSELETPFYSYNLDLLNKTLINCKKYADKYNFKIHYALKANANSRLLKLVSNAGFGADCVSGNEISVALETGFKHAEIVFAGVGKTDKEIKLALQSDIHSFNCESLAEIQVINQLASNLNKTAKIALRINPNVNPSTHHYITTGLDENKFGIHPNEIPSILDELKRSKHIQLTGIHFHIGSQITNLEVFKNLCIRVNFFIDWFESKNIQLENINVGGGLGINYENPESDQIPDFESYFAIFQQFLSTRKRQQVHFELGRSLIAQCGDLICRVIYTKKTQKTEFIILDGGMTELIRPALYQAQHKIMNLSSDKDTQIYDVVGPICESSDCFGKHVVLNEAQRGDIIAIRSAGAYGEVMSSNYNLRKMNHAYFY